MSKCKVWFEFDQGDRTYKVGDPISGFVHLRVNKTVTVNRVYLRMEWRTHGRGNKKRGGRDEFDFLGQTMLSAGEDHSFPFRFTAPAGPLTYRGHYLNVDWYLRAAVDLPWAIDPKADEDFIVVRGPDTQTELSQGNSEAFSMAMQGSKISAITSIIGLVFGLVFAMFGSLFFLAGILMAVFQGFTFHHLPFILMGGMFALVGLGIAFSSQKKKLAGKKVGDVQLTLNPMAVRGGQEVDCRLSFVPKDVAAIEKVELTLTCRERVVSGSGTSRTSRSHEVLALPETFHPGGEWANGMPATIEHSFRIPEDAPPSFYAQDNTLTWSVTADFHLTRWPDYSETVLLKVR